MTVTGASSGLFRLQRTTTTIEIAASTVLIRIGPASGSQSHGPPNGSGSDAPAKARRHPLEAIQRPRARTGKDDLDVGQQGEVVEPPEAVVADCEGDREREVGG